MEKELSPFGDPVTAFSELYFGILVVVAQNLAAVHDEVHDPAPFFISQVAVRKSIPDLTQSFPRLKSVSGRKCEKVLYEYVNRL